MLKKIFISFFVLIFLALVSFPIVFFYSEKARLFIISQLNIKHFVNERIENYLSDKINNKNISIEINSIDFLQPSFPNIINIRLNNIIINSITENQKSKIRIVEIGFNHKSLMKNIFNHNDIHIDYLDFKDLTLSARLDGNNFSSDPLIQIFSLINKSDTNNHNLKKILENKITVGNVDLKLTDNRNQAREVTYEIKCQNVFLSRYIEKKRNLDMSCQEKDNLIFSMNISLNDGFNVFTGNVKNLPFEKILDKKFIKIINADDKKFRTNMNGNFNFSTDKNLKLQTLNFSAENSILTFEKTTNNEILSLNFDGDMYWDSTDNILKFDKISMPNNLITSGEINFKNKSGFSKIIIENISLKNLKNHLVNREDFYINFIDLTFFKNFQDKFKGGSLNNLIVFMEYEFKQKFNLNDMVAKLNFQNIRYEDKNVFFKKILTTISGESSLNIKFRENKIDNKKTKVLINLEASNGSVLLQDYSSPINFEKGIVDAYFDQGIYKISRANLFSKDNSKFFFEDVIINDQNLKISKATFTKNKKNNYIFENTEINNLRRVTSSVNFTDNTLINSYLKEKLNIDLAGDNISSLKILGDLKTFDFNLKLKSDLTNSSFNIRALNLNKNEQIVSSLETEIIIKNRELKFLKNLNLLIENNLFYIEDVGFDNEKSNQILFTNIRTPSLDLKKILLTKNEGIINLSINGKSINLSNYENRADKILLRNKIAFDITADQILVNKKIGISGNLKGKLENSIITSVAYGKMELGETSLLDSGKFEIYVDNKIAKLSGIGLVGGAETKIELIREKDKFPSIYFDTLDGGKLLDTLGFTKNLRSGEMQMTINFLNDSYTHYKGAINSKNFSLKNAPGIINSLSVLSFAGIQSVIVGEGVFFEKGKVNINVKNDLFVFDNLFLSSESLAIKGQGELNLKKKTVDMIGTVAPVRLLSRVLSLVPAVGQLLTGIQKDGLLAGQFKMSGSIEKPEINLNPMSFAPGILRDIFAKDWLEDNKLLLQPNSN